MSRLATSDLAAFDCTYRQEIVYRVENRRAISDGRERTLGRIGYSRRQISLQPVLGAQGQQAHCNLTTFPHWVRRRAAETDGAYHPAMAMEPSPVLVAIREDLARLEAAAAASPPLDERVVAYTGGTPPHPWTVYVADVICADLERCGLFPRS